MSEENDAADDANGDGEQHVFDPVVTAFAGAEKHGILRLEYESFLIFGGDDVPSEELVEKVILVGGDQRQMKSRDAALSKQRLVFLRRSAGRTGRRAVHQPNNGLVDVPFGYGRRTKLLPEIEDRYLIVVAGVECGLSGFAVGLIEGKM